MKHNEIMEADMYEPGQDKSMRKMSDTRKPKITLRNLNRLRKMREVKKAEQQKSASTLEIQYASSGSDE